MEALVKLEYFDLCEMKKKGTELKENKTLHSAYRKLTVRVTYFYDTLAFT